MNIFADDCVRLKYNAGTVSFCLESTQSAYAGTTVHVPFSVFAAMQAQFSSAFEGVAQEHSAWLAEQAPAAGDEKAAAVPTPMAARDELGPRIASV